MDELLSPTKKLIFAEYLISRDDPEPFLTGAHKHIIDAAREILIVLTHLEGKDIDSKQVTKRVLNKFEEPEPKKFFQFYLTLSERESLDKQSATNALNKVKEFIKWVEEHKQNK